MTPWFVSLQASGFTVVGGSRDGMDVQIEGPVSAIETAFHVSMGTYQHPTENRTFYAPDREPTVGLPFPLWHISGLDNYSIPHPMFVKKSDYAKAHGIAPKSRRLPCHHRLRPFGFLFGQRHARGLLRRNGA
jgi:subtilase family serine protease